MMRTWSDWLMPSVVQLDTVGTRAAVISQNGGESSEIYEIGEFPGWLAKLYKTPPSDDRVQALDQLIALPQKMDDRDLLIADTSIAWPVSRITDGDRTVGIVLAKAPDNFFGDVTTAEGRTRHVTLTVDHLAKPDAYHVRLGLPSSTLHDRLIAVRSLVAAGDLLERFGLVYGDWSYSNALWSPRDREVFVIDVDSCGFSSRPWIETNAWNDPLVPWRSPLTTYTDRYKLTLLVLRCLTGVRNNDLSALAALPAPLSGGPIHKVLSDSLTAATVTARPSMPELLRALDQAIEPNMLATASVQRLPRWNAVHPAASPAATDPARPSPDRPSGRSAAEEAANVIGWKDVGAARPEAAPPNLDMPPLPDPDVWESTGWGAPLPQPYEPAEPIRPAPAAFTAACPAAPRHLESGYHSPRGIALAAVLIIALIIAALVWIGIFT